MTTWQLRDNHAVISSSSSSLSIYRFISRVSVYLSVEPAAINVLSVCDVHHTSHTVIRLTDTSSTVAVTVETPENEFAACHSAPSVPWPILQRCRPRWTQICTLSISMTRSDPTRRISNPTRPTHDDPKVGFSIKSIYIIRTVRFIFRNEKSCKHDMHKKYMRYSERQNKTS